MNYLFIEYPRCSTCKNAKDWLKSHEFDFEERDIVNQVPTASELKAWLVLSGLPLKRFFNTSGLVYKALNLKERLPLMNEEEQIELLSSNGMLIKRPLLIGKDCVLIGFKELEYDRLSR